MPGTQGWARWRFVIAPKWIAWHLFMAAAVYGMLALGDWQFRRAQAGNALSWAYTFEWPFFAILAVVFWGKTLRDEAHPRAPVPSPDETVTLPAGARGQGAGASRVPADPAADPATAAEDAELAAYNAYLVRLHREVKGHGKWHGWR